MSALHQTTDQTETESFPAVGLAAPIPAQRLASSMAARMLLSGGDERLSIDPATGRNRYLTSPTPRDDETPFGSSTANTITRLGYRAAVADLGRVLAVDHGRRNTIQEWIETQRASLIARFGNRDSDLVFASSGTDTELFAGQFATIVAGSPLTNVLMAPAETGSGVPFAARGERFLSSTPFGGAKPPGERLEGMEHLDIELETIAILDSRGNPRPAEDVDDDAFRVVSAALAKGRSALLHLLDVSKTGGGGPSLAAARQIAALAPGRVVVAVDCCQMRSSAQRVRQYVDAGFLVMLTGSKFAGGPPFSGAMIAPREVFEQARISKSPLPPGLRASTALLDWPESFRARAAPTAGVHVNLGLALRWSASLSEIDRFSDLSSDLATQVAAAFEVHVRAVAEGSRHHHPIDCRNNSAEWARTIVPVAIQRRDGRFASLREVQKLQARLLDIAADGAPSRRGRRFQVGQAVCVGDKVALRVCLGAPTISDIVERAVQSRNVEREMAPLRALLDELFHKADHLMATA